MCTALLHFGRRCGNHPRMRDGVGPTLALVARSVVRPFNAALPPLGQPRLASYRMATPLGSAGGGTSSVLTMPAVPLAHFPEWPAWAWFCALPAAVCGCVGACVVVWRWLTCMRRTGFVWSRAPPQVPLHVLAGACVRPRLGSHVDRTSRVRVGQLHATPCFCM